MHLHHGHGKHEMEHLLGLLRVRIIRGVNLAYRDTRGSDPYVVVRMAGQKVKTSVKKKNVNPEWNEDLTLSVTDQVHPIQIVIYDRDRFSRDDKMGEAELDIQPFLDAVNKDLSCYPNNALIDVVKPNRENCLADESQIVWRDSKVIQDVILRLRNVESGELEIQLAWVNIPRM